MEFTINVHVTGLDKLANAIASISAAKSKEPARVKDTVSTPDPQPTAMNTSEPVQPAPVAPAAAPAYTVDELARAAAPLMSSAADVQTLCNLLAQFGVQSLQQLPEDQYGAFATALRGLGANI